MADSKITALTALTAADPANDMFPVVDVSDTTMAASGTTKRISINNILACSPSATLASASISGDLTVATNRLSVSSTGVQIGTTTNKTTAFTGNGTGLTIGAALAPTIALWDTTNASYVGSISQIDADMYVTNTGAGQMVFSTDNASRYTISSTGISTWSVGGSTAMTLNSTGLGVGVTPAQKLTVLTNIGVSATTAAAADDRLIFTENMASANLGSQIVWKTASSGNAYASIGITNGAAGNTGTLIFSTSSSIFGSNNVERMRIDNAGNPIFQPSATPATLGTNGMLTVNATSNTNLRFSYRGSDGTTRVANITLA